MAQMMMALNIAAEPAQRRRRWLTLARVAWALLVAFDLLMFALSVGPSFALYQQPCVDEANADCSAAQLTLADWRGMQAHGVTPTAYGIFALVVIVSASLIFFAVGFLIAWRKWGDMMALFVSAILITFGSTGISNSLTSTGDGPAALGIAQGAIVVLSYPALATFMLTFPTGRFAPRWTAWIVLLWIVQFGVFFFGAPPYALAVSVVITWGSCALTQVYRYRRIYTPAQRRQTKWVVFSLALACALAPLTFALPALIPDLNTPGSLFRLGGVVGLAMFWAPISLGVGIAILRARLYDIDLLINRALVYGLLTAILGAVYAGGVIGGQRLLSALTGAHAEETPVSIALTTLLVAALFQPLRRRLQALIDRRFFRSRYNAARAVAGFSATLRAEVNLHGLTDHLLDIVDETVRPEHVSLWLRPEQRPEQRSADHPAEHRPAARFSEAPEPTS